MFVPCFGTTKKLFVSLLLTIVPAKVYATGVAKLDFSLDKEHRYREMEVKARENSGARLLWGQLCSTKM